MPSASFHFDVAANGLKVLLGPTEAELMELAWTNESLTVKSALFHLGGDDRRAYTTVMTVLNRLADKGLLSRTRDGRNFTYRAVIERAEFVRDRVDHILSCLKRNFPEACEQISP